MRLSRETRALAAGWLLLAAGGAAAEPAGFSATLPDAVVDVSAWQLVSGDFESPGLRGHYRFYVNPARQGLYQLMRYRTAGAGPGAPLDAERVAFVPRPGVREPMLCWRREAPGRQPEWRAVAAGSPEYLAEMAMVMRLLSIHRSALRQR